MIDDPYGMNPYGITNNPYAQQMMPNEPYTPTPHNHPNNQMEMMKPTSPHPENPYDEQQQISYDQISNHSIQNQNQNEDESLPYYCQSNNLHGIVHPLEKLSIRRPGIDRRSVLYDEHGKIPLYTNVILVNELTVNVDERKISLLFNRMCSYRKIFVSNQKKYAFITLYTRKDALNVFHHLINLQMTKRIDFGYSVMWGRDVWMKKEDSFDNKNGILTTSVESIPTNIMVNFDKTYVYVDDVLMVYGVEPQPIEVVIPQIQQNEYQNMQNVPPMTHSPSSDYHQFHDQQMGYQNMMYNNQTSPQRDPQRQFQNQRSPSHDQNGYRPMNRNQRPR